MGTLRGLAHSVKRQLEWATRLSAHCFLSICAHQIEMVDTPVNDKLLGLRIG